MVIYFFRLVQKSAASQLCPSHIQASTPTYHIYFGGLGDVVSLYVYNKMSQAYYLLYNEYLGEAWYRKYYYFVVNIPNIRNK